MFVVVVVVAGAVLKLVQAAASGSDSATTLEEPWFEAPERLPPNGRYRCFGGDDFIASS